MSMARQKAKGKRGAVKSHLDLEGEVSSGKGGVTFTTPPSSVPQFGGSRTSSRKSSSSPTKIAGGHTVSGKGKGRPSKGGSPKKK